MLLAAYPYDLSNTCMCFVIRNIRSASDLVPDTRQCVNVRGRFVIHITCHIADIPNLDANCFMEDCENELRHIRHIRPFDSVRSDDVID